MILIILTLSCRSDIRWQVRLETVIQDFGHRNWIVVADYAYPRQSAEGIETIFTGRDHLEVLDRVLETIGKAPHVSPTIMIDRELQFLGDEDAPGIEKYRSELEGRLGNREVTSMPHEAIISRLDEASELFSVLILKTTMTLPYTSVFIELDCGYWDAGKEQHLRNSMDKIIPEE